METVDHADPLMGHAQFLEELETPPQQAVSDVALSGVPAPGAPVAKARSRPVEPRGRGPHFMMPEVNAAPIVEAAQSPAMRRVLVVAGFVLMMSIGAAAAALVFHDRVAQIVSVWPIAGR